MSTAGVFICAWLFRFLVFSMLGAEIWNVANVKTFGRADTFILGALAALFWGAANLIERRQP